MNRIQLDILGLSEVRWPNNGITNIMGKTFYYSGNTDSNHYNGIGMILNSELSKAVTNFVPLSDRCMLLQIKGAPININLIQVYALTADKTPDELEQWYEDVEKLLSLTKKQDLNIVMGDFNAKIGQGRVAGLIGDFGLGERNERGDRLVEFCQKNRMLVANTWFKLHPRRLYTWTSPLHTANRIIRNQIDFILIDERHRNSVKLTKTYPGADANSDHNPVVSTIRLRLKIIKNTVKSTSRPNIHCLRDNTIKEKVATELNRTLSNVERSQTTPHDINNTWACIKNAIVNTIEEQIPKTIQRAKKDWMTTEILHMMDERRKYKNKNIQEYKQRNKEIRKKIKNAKEQWLNDKCKEIEDLQRKHDYFNMYRKIREFTFSNRKYIQQQLVNQTGALIQNTDDKLKEWEQYITKLFDNSRGITPVEEENKDGPPILKTEIQHAIKQLKINKSPGPDEIYPETLKLINEDNIDLFVTLYNRIYESGQIPEEWLESTFVPVPKHNHSRKCEDFRLISLMSQALKILLKILHNRLFRKCEEEIGRDQFGFRSGMGTREALFCVNVLCQKCYDQQKDVFLCFVDFEKAFDRVNHEKMLKALKDIGLDTKDFAIIRNLYYHQNAKIRIEGQTSNNIRICRGVRQGCVLSPMLFNLYSELIFKKVFEKVTSGVTVNGVQIPSVRYADDTVLIANSDIELQSVLDQLSKTCEEFGMKINEKGLKLW